MSEAAEKPKTTIVVAGRLSYADIFVPREYKKGDGNFRYKADILIPKEETTVGGVKMGGKAVYKKIVAAIAAAKEEEWGSDKSSHPRIPASKVCLKDGDSDEYGTEDSAGHWILRASDTEKPTALARNGRTELTQEDGLLYSGSYANVIVNMWAQNNEWAKRINANLNAVQHVAEGEKFGKTRVKAQDMFGSLDDDDDTGFDDIDDEGEDDELSF